MILVTGGSGFIGSALIERLSSSDLTGVRGTFRSREKAPPGVSNFAVVPSIDGRNDWTEALNGVEVVVHTAARVHVMRETVSNPAADYNRINVEGTLHLARQAAERGVKRFVFLSSIKVNGSRTPAGRPFTAEDVPEPDGPYGESKLQAEQGLKEIAAQTGLEVVIVRPVLVYGPGVKGNFRTLLRVIEKGIPLPVGSLRNKRSLVGLSNLVDFISVCIRNPAAAGQVFLVSDGEDLSTPELLRRVGHAMGRPARIFPFPETLLRAGARMVGRSDAVERLADSLQVDMAKNRELLGWEPRTSLDEELRRTTAALRRG